MSFMYPQRVNETSLDVVVAGAPQARAIYPHGGLKARIQYPHEGLKARIQYPHVVLGMAAWAGLHIV